MQLLRLHPFRNRLPNVRNRWHLPAGNVTIAISTILPTSPNRNEYCLNTYKNTDIQIPHELSLKLMTMVGESGVITAALGISRLA